MSCKSFQLERRKRCADSRRWDSFRRLWAYALLVSIAHLTPVWGQVSVPVAPTQEIEVLDPNADPLGRPSVELARDGKSGQLQVDIPPAVVVHKFYYTGDRSFQAQSLPGGPTIIVANHPKTNERCYIETQMLPGAPRVTYRHRSIDYDYGRHGMTVIFSALGGPLVKYRSHRTPQKWVADTIHYEHFKVHTEKFVDHTKQVGRQSKTMVAGAMAEGSQLVEQATLPVTNFFQMLPFGKAIFGSDLHGRLAQSAAEHERDKEIKRKEKQERFDSATIPTVR